MPELDEVRSPPVPNQRLHPDDPRRPKSDEFSTHPHPWEDHPSNGRDVLPPSRPHAGRESARPTQALPRHEDQDYWGRDCDDLTEGIHGLDIKKLNISPCSYTIELFDSKNNWVPLFQVAGIGKSPIFGRSHALLDRGMDTMAERHVRFINTPQGLLVEALNSLNGVFVQITRRNDRDRSPRGSAADENRPSIFLEDGLRFRIGDYVLEFREEEHHETLSPRIAEDGERFLAKDLWPLAYLDFIRPDGQPGVRFPILRETPTVLGRGGVGPNGVIRHVHIPLPHDKLVSGQHAEIHLEKDRFVLVDLGSRNHTYVQIREPTRVADGTMICLGKIYLRVVQTR